MKVTRRGFLQTAAMAGAMAGLRLDAGSRSITGAFSGSNPGFIDINVSLGQWPFRRLPLDEAQALVRKLHAEGVKQAWAGSFEALLHKDMGAVNSRLAGACKKHGRGLLIPFGSVNPKLPDWEEELRRCAESHGMPGLRLYPNYHGYKVGDPLFERLLKAAAARGMILQLAASMEDERMQHPLVRVPNVDLSHLPVVLERVGTARVVLLNWFRAVKPDLLARLREKVWFDIAMIESVAGVETLLKKVPAERVVFGSHAPFYYFAAAALKLKESELSPEQAGRIRHGNAAGLLA